MLQFNSAKDLWKYFTGDGLPGEGYSGASKVILYFSCVYGNTVFTSDALLRKHPGYSRLCTSGISVNLVAKMQSIVREEDEGKEF